MAAFILILSVVHHSKALIKLAFFSLSLGLHQLESSRDDLLSRPRIDLGMSNDIDSCRELRLKESERMLALKQETIYYEDKYPIYVCILYAFNISEPCALQG